MIKHVETLKVSPTRPIFPLSWSCVWPPPQRAFTAAVRLYDNGDYEGAIALFEDALVEYYKADVECRALCQWPQRFEGYDFLRYRYSLHEVISGKSQWLIRSTKEIFFFLHNPSDSLE